MMLRWIVSNSAECCSYGHWNVQCMPCAICVWYFGGAFVKLLLPLVKLSIELGSH